MSKLIRIKKEKGQVMVIMAIALVVLLVFVGLAIDGTQLFLNYTRLKRAVDSAAVAAANDFRQGVTLAQMQAAAVEILDMQQIHNTVNIKVYMCDRLSVGDLPTRVDDHPDGTTDAYLATEVPEFFNQCPKPGLTLKKKLIYVRAFENSPTAFLTLLGINSVPISTTATSEAAPVDLVIVLDTSMSMGVGAGSDPNTCNSTPGAPCLPLKNAKDAAVQLINKLYPGYDQVAIVSYDTVGLIRYDLGQPAGAITALNDPAGVPLHLDPSPGLMPGTWGVLGRFNPMNPEDRNNDGQDNDATISCQVTNPLGTPDPNDPGHWDYRAGYNIPCDNPSYYDTLDWNGDGNITTGTGGYGSCTPADSDHCLTQAWMYQHNPVNHDPPITPPLPVSFVSTCTGCGIRVATNVLTREGRANAVWVMVFLTDGVVQMSDTAQTFPYNSTTKIGIPTQYPNGFCGGRIIVNGTPGPTPGVPNYWMDYCKDTSGSRHCINADPLTCPPNSTPLPVLGSSPPYSVLDYAKDMTDAAALRKSSNVKEKLGNDIAIYTIMFSNSDATIAQGAPLLRYMADIGVSGDRDTHPCVDTDPTNASPKTWCGQYYYSPTSSEALTRVFLDIASRIYTKISE